MPKKSFPVTRRGALKWLAASGAAAIGTGAAFPLVLARPQTVRVGALIPTSGDAGPYARQMRLGINTAIAEINSAGGVLGRNIEVAYRDSETLPSVLPEHCRELVDDWGAIAVVGPWVSAGRKYAARFLASRGIPLLHASNHEAGFCSSTLFSVGPTTSHDGHTLVRYLDERGMKDYFMLGSYPSWQNTMFRQLRFPMHAYGHSVHGQALTAIGERQFRPIIRWIQQTETASVLFCVMRKHGQAFLHQARELGLLEKITVGWIGFNDVLIDGLWPEELERIVTASPFVMRDTEGGVPDFVARVRARHGNVPVSHLVLTHYNAVKALQAAWERSGELSAEGAVAGLRGLTFESPTGPVHIDAEHQHATMNVVIARGSPDGLRIIKRLGPVAPDPGCHVQSEPGGAA